MTAPRMLQDAAPLPDRRKRRCKAAIVIALDLPLTRALNPKRLPRPKLPPPLAWRVRNNLVGAGIFPRVSLLIPRINARKIVVVAIGFNKKSRYHCNTPNSRSAISAE